MKIYIAVQKGVYRHDIVAACSTLERAIELGKEAIKNESDHFHSIEIVERELDKDGEENLVCTLIPQRVSSTTKNSNYLKWELTGINTFTTRLTGIR